MAATVSSYYGITITLNDTSAHNLLALLTAIDATLSATIQNCLTLRIQSDDSNGSNAVFIGDSNLSTNRMGYRLLAHDQVPYSVENAYNVPLGLIYVLAQGGTPLKVNVEILF